MADMKATWQEINAWVLDDEGAEEVRKEVLGFWGHDNTDEMRDGDNGSSVYGCFNSASVVMLALLKAGGVDVNAEGAEWTPNGLMVAEGLVGLVSIAYGDDDLPRARNPKWTSRLWTSLGMSGDDDVDYSGSYVSMGIDVLRAYMIAHGEADVVKNAWDK